MLVAFLLLALAALMVLAFVGGYGAAWSVMGGSAQNAESAQEVEEPVEEAYRRWGDRVAILDRGRVIREGTVAELTAGTAGLVYAYQVTPLTPEQKSELRSDPRLEVEDVRIFAKLEDEDELQALNDRFRDLGIQVRGLAEVRQTLEDARWHHRAHAVYAASPRGKERPEYNASLAALEPGVYEGLDKARVAQQPVSHQALDGVPDNGLVIAARGQLAGQFPLAVLAARQHVHRRGACTRRVGRLFRLQLPVPPGPRSPDRSYPAVRRGSCPRCRRQYPDSA